LFTLENIIPKLSDATPQDILPANPFLTDDCSPPLALIALENLKNITAIKHPNYFLLKNKSGVIGRAFTFKNAFKLGDDIVIGLDFTSGTVQCIQFVINLQCEEYVKNFQDHPKKIIPPNKITNITTVQEICLSLKKTHATIPIPLHVTPTFSTDLVELSWKLDFQFLTSKSKQQKIDSDNWMLPRNVEVESVVWTLPITVFTTSPAQLLNPTNEFKMYLK
jgi:hypothetical protein